MTNARFGAIPSLPPSKQSHSLRFPVPPYAPRSFFERYPAAELSMTAALFGAIIHHQLVTSISLGIALKYVLDALRQPRHTNMFRFGLDALAQIKGALLLERFCFVSTSVPA